MAIDFKQTQELVVDTLETFLPYNVASASQLLMLTAAVESNGGTYIRQIRGPAITLMQLEPATIESIITYVRRKANAAKEDRTWVYIYEYLTNNMDKYISLINGNMPAAILLARIKYYMDPKPLGDGIDEHALTWKRVYNTNLGKGDPADAVHKYNLWKEGKL